MLPVSEGEKPIVTAVLLREGDVTLIPLPD